ncbi:phage portal protein [Nonomuraea basaltis]|uniref:phage portal protein n=1 Tax=Nonomuraea basaltis TaxID=2495887 RepID=UPI00110C4848|nr:phage portal protein [Nonomuraea basaltis]TMR92395.1 phage portal protein [Nonomuraea basaltis]
MAFLPALRGVLGLATKSAGLETKSFELDAGHTSWSGMLARLRDPRRSWPVERAVLEGMERVVWVFKSVNAIAGHASRLPIERVLIKDDGEREVIADDPLARLLNAGVANQLEKGPQLRKRLSGQVLLSPAGTFVEVTTSRRGHPIGADLLPPGRTRPVPGFNGNLLSHFETITPDGRRRAIDPEKVIWFRDPHPLDPFRGITPMEAAGLSVDLDFLARLYNATFLRNDGRPGGVIGIDGEVDDDEMERIQGIFGKGAHEAGKLTVLQGDLSFIDLAAKPRDMAYADLARISKEEILAAFGVPESVIGNASGRTFDNAAQEQENFWEHTMLPHLSLLATGWDTDHEDDARYEFNVDGVEPLQRAKRQRRQEAREEVAAGLISLDEYRAIAGYDPVDLPHTRALYVAQGKTPIPTREEDAVALGIAPPEDPEAAMDGAAAAGELGGQPPAGDAVPAEEGDDGAEENALSRLRALFDENGGGEQEPTNGEPAASAPGGNADAGEKPEQEPEEGDAEEEEAKPKRGRRQTKGAPAPEPRAELVEVLNQLGGRLVGRTVARLESPKYRKGTRHFIAEYKVDTRVGDSPLDMARIVPVEAWQTEAEQAVFPVFAAAATAAGGGVEAHDTAMTAAVAVGEEFGRVAGVVRAVVEDLDQAGAPMEEIAQAVREVDLTDWAAAIAAEIPI